MFELLFKPRPHRVLAALISSEPRETRLHAIQIGANDGILADPLDPMLKRFANLYASRVEPIDNYYKSLLRNCASSVYSGRVKCIHAAVSRLDGYEEMILPGEGHAHNEMMQGLARLSSVQNVSGYDESDWQSLRVRTISPDSLIQEALYPWADIYISDCEGYDVDLLELIPLSRMKTRVICIEMEYSGCSSNSDLAEKMRRLWGILGENGFNSSVWDGFNLVAWKSPASWSSRRPRLIQRDFDPDGFHSS